MTDKPALPEPEWFAGSVDGYFATAIRRWARVNPIDYPKPFYTADQMHAFRAEGVAAERERARGLREALESLMSDNSDLTLEGHLALAKKARAALAAYDQGKQP